jgi:hypothetical protein
MAGDAANRGKHIISAAKSLKRKALDDSMIASYLYATEGVPAPDDDFRIARCSANALFRAPSRISCGIERTK